MTMSPSEALALLRTSISATDGHPSFAALNPTETQTLLQCIDEAESEVMCHSESSPSTCSARLIVLEGLDGVGKTTTAKGLREKVPSALHLNTPPPALSAYRKAFDEQPDSLLRRAYYTLGNILVSKELRKLESNRTVVLDRFWPSTYAYQVAKSLSTSSQSVDYDKCEIPSIQWPWYLVKPTTLVLLVLDEKTRLDRMGLRGITFTEEEIALDKDLSFRKLVLRVYTSIPGVTQVDTSIPAHEVVQHILDLV